MPVFGGAKKCRAYGKYTEGVEMTIAKYFRRGMLCLMGLSFVLSGLIIYRTALAADSDFPRKEITLIVSFGAGGQRDTLARGVANTMSKYLGVPIVVSNVPGAGGIRGAVQLYHAAPDGYTIGIGNVTEIVMQLVEKNIEYDMRKFTHIGFAQSSPAYFFVKSDSPLRKIADLKAMGKPVRHGTFAPTNPNTVALISLAKREGFPLVLVGGFTTVPATILSLLRGEVEVISSSMPGAASFLKAGQIRPILTLSPKRTPEFPDIPTAGELGYPDLGLLGLDYWFMAPPGVPKERVKILDDALLKTQKDPAFITWAKGAGVDPYALNSEDTTKRVMGLMTSLEVFKADVEKFVKK